jgi:molybdate transport system substrate-binding protein
MNLRVITCSALLLAASATLAAEIKILSGAAVFPVMEVLVPRFEREQKHKVAMDFDGPIGGVKNRIAAGETADVIIVSAQHIEFLEAHGKVIPGSRADLGELGLGVFVRKGAPKPDISTVDTFKRALLAAKSIVYPTAGTQASTHLLATFERLGIAAQMKAKTVPSRHRTDRFDSVVKGGAELGFSQMSQILAMPGVDLVGPLPSAVQHYTLFSAAIAQSSRERDAAKAFINFLTTPAAAAVMKEKGFER